MKILQTLIVLLMALAASTAAAQTAPYTPPSNPDSASFLAGQNVSNAPAYTQIRYEHFQKAFGTGKNFGVARAVPGIRAELVRCGTGIELADSTFANADGLIEFQNVDTQGALNAQNLGELCVRMHGESQLEPGNSAARTRVSYGATMFGFEQNCDDANRVATPLTWDPCPTWARFEQVWDGGQCC
jgi:hypothetical protein